MLDIRRKLQVAVVPVVASASVSGPSLESTRDALRGELVIKAAAEIARQVNNAVITTQQEKAQDQAAQNRHASGQILYLVQLQGVASRERDRIRVVREALSRVVPGGAAQVDPQRSTETQITIAVTSPRAVAIDDLIDALYAAHHEITSFEAVSTGTNQIKVRY